MTTILKLRRYIARKLWWDQRIDEENIDLLLARWERMRDDATKNARAALLPGLIDNRSEWRGVKRGLQICIDALDTEKRRAKGIQPWPRYEGVTLEPTTQTSDGTNPPQS
jgi:hypothetical protein